MLSEAVARAARERSEQERETSGQPSGQGGGQTSGQTSGQGGGQTSGQTSGQGGESR